MGGNHLGGAQVVTRKAILAHQEAESTAQGEASDAGRRDRTAGCGQPVSGCGGVEPAPLCAAAGAGGPRGRIDHDFVQCREINHEGAVADG